MADGTQKEILRSLVDTYKQQPADKFAPVVPYHFYQQMIVSGYVPNTVLLLAHDVVKHAEKYAEVFSDPKFNTVNIIMDNSVIELGKAVDTQMVFDAAEIVHADVVVLPDVLSNAEATISATMDVYDEWKWKFRDYKLMALIQGTTERDWLHCAETFAKHTKLDWVGIPRITEHNLTLHRHDLVTLATSIFPNANIHLFGFSDYIWYDILAAKHPAVSSIDSAAPFRCEDPAFLMSEAFGPRGDWWETAKYDPKVIEICQRINDLISH